MKIFISYSRNDADFAQHIYEYFSESGHDIFIDVTSIQLGSVWSKTIEMNISNCDIFVVIITYVALRSSEIEKEVLQAQRENKMIIPCIHRDVRYDDIKWSLNKLQGIEFEDKYELARNLYSRIGKSQEKGHKDDTSLFKDREESRKKTHFDGQQVKKPRRRTLKVLAAVVIIIITVVVIFGIGRSYFISALVHQGDVLRGQGKYAQAIFYYDIALAIDPNNRHASHGKHDAQDLLDHLKQHQQ